MGFSLISALCKISSVYSNDTDDFDNTNNAEVSSVKTVHPQNMPSGYFEDTGDKDGK